VATMIFYMRVIHLCI